MHVARVEEAERSAGHSARAENRAAARGCRDRRGPAARREKPGHRRRGRRARSRRFPRACRAGGGPWRSRHQWSRQRLHQLSQEQPHVDGLLQLQPSRRQRSDPARQRQGALVSAVEPAGQGQDRRDQREPAEDASRLSGAVRRSLSRGRRGERAAPAGQGRRARRRGQGAHRRASRPLDGRARQAHRQPRGRRARVAFGREARLHRAGGGRGGILPQGHHRLRRDHHAHAADARASAAERAAKLLPRDGRRARAGHRRGAWRQARRARPAGRAVHRRRIVPLQSDHSVARRVQDL